MPTSEQIEQARENYGTYYLLLNPTFGAVPYQQELICPALEDLERGDINRLMILMAPGHSKTRLVTAGCAPWVIGRRPDREILIISYGDKPAAEFGQTIRDLLYSDVHRAIFPWCRIRGAQHAKSYFQTTMGGKVYAVGWGGAIARIRADFIFIDDPLKNYEEAVSQPIIEARMRTFDSVVKDRLKPGGKIVLCTNRWAPRDMVGRVLEREGHKWTMVELQSEPAPDSPQAKFLEPGTIYLWEKHFGKERYEDKKRDQWAWQTTEQQRPEDALPNRFEQKWIKYYAEKIKPGRFHTCMIVDPALSTHKKADRTSIMVLAGGPTMQLRGDVNIGQILLVDWALDRLNPDQRTAKICALADHWEVDFILYEEVGLSSDTFYLERDSGLYGLNTPIIPVGRRAVRGMSAMSGGRPTKEMRIMSLMQDFREGRIILPDKLLYKQQDGEIVDLIDYFVQQEYLPWSGDKSIPHDEGLDTLSRIHDAEFTLEFEEAPPKETDETDEAQMARERGQFAGKVRESARGSWFGRF